MKTQELLLSLGWKGLGLALKFGLDFRCIGFRFVGCSRQKFNDLGAV
jgi:hypothetical protein